MNELKRRMRDLAGSRIYFVAASRLRLIKIGIAADVDQRFYGLQQASPVELQLLLHVAGDHELERAVHFKFEHARYRSEWFHTTPDLRHFIEALGAMSEQRAAQTIKNLPTAPPVTRARRSAWVWRRAS